MVSRPLVFEWREGLPLGPRAYEDRSVVLRAPGDALQLYYQLWLARDGVLGPTPLFRDPYQFRLDGARWNLLQTFPPLAIPFTVLGALGPHTAFNLLVVLSFPLAGLAAYVLVRHYTGDSLAAAVAGTAFALVPARLGPLFGGQPAGFAAALVPLVLWGLDVALTRGRLWGGLVGGGAMLALATLEPHYTYFVTALGIAYVPLRFLGARPTRIPWGPLLIFVILAGAGAGWLLALRQEFLVDSIAATKRGLDEIRQFSPGPGALLRPETYGGGLLLGLAGAGLVLRSDLAGRALRLFFALVLVAGALVSLGPTVPHLPLYQLLHAWVPLFGLIRNPEKFRLLTALGATVLAGLTIQHALAQVPRRWRHAAAAAGVCGVAAATAPWHPIVVTRLPPTAVYATLRADRDRILHLPVWPGDSAWSSLYLYDTTRTRVPMVNGYSPLVARRYVAEVFRPLQGLNVGDLGPGEYARLRQLGITHVVLNRAAFPPEASPFPSQLTRQRLDASPSLTLERAADPLWVYRVTDRAPPGPPPVTSPVGLFFEAETLGRETGLVVGDPVASGARIVAARSGATPPGFLTFGPYRLLPTGAYRATFRVRGSGLTIEATAEEGQRVLARQPLGPLDTWAEVPLGFTLDRARPVEFRVRWTGRGDAAVDWVLVVFADRADPEWAFEVEELGHQLGERPDPAASGGWAGYADAVETRPISLITSPARLYPPGRYRMELRARTEAPTGKPLGTLLVQEASGRPVASRAVRGTELPPGAYGALGLEFELTRPTALNFSMRYSGSVGLYLDRVTVTRR